ncbi:DUF4883 family protein [Clostridium sp. BJN0001]|uniref:DUF4883 family protein n=1 Tax=Clostridium sp. BJN0001 TaxID=2930219 RepID=UPI001FD18674|nr:DUF4883 family protein [Clostridium sp. BJN0001]
MKKLIIFICSFFIFILFSSCAIPNIYTINTKPSPNYYYTNLSSKISNTSFDVSIIDTNFYKNVNLTDEYKDMFKNFISYINIQDITEDSTKTFNKEAYRIHVKFSDGSKYLIKVIDKETILLNPEDGRYSEDIISMKNIPVRYNLYDLCTNLLNMPLKIS